MKKTFVKYFMLCVLPWVWIACDSTSKSNDEEKESEKQEVKLDQDAEAAIVEEESENPLGEVSLEEEQKKKEEGFFVSVMVDEVEKTFAFVPQDEEGKSNDYIIEGEDQSRLLIQRFYDASKEERISLLFYNFELPKAGASLPVTFSANPGKGQLTRVVYSFKDKEGKRQAFDARNNFSVTITKIEGDVYEGSFEGKFRKRNIGLFKATGSFKVRIDTKDVRPKKPVS